MADQIRITPDMMRERARQYGEQAEMVGNVIHEMDNLLAALQEEWEGQSSRSYAEKYGELRPGFLKAQELIGQISSALTETARTIEETDAAIAAQFK